VAKQKLQGPQKKELKQNRRMWLSK